MINSVVRHHRWQAFISPRRLLRGMSGGFALIMLGGFGCTGCSGTDTTGIPLAEMTNPYAQLQLNVRAAVMSTVSPYDTLQLTPTAYDANGNVIPLPGPITYTENDTVLHVSASGLLTLTHKTSTSSSMVIVSVQDTVHRLTHADTAFILGTTTVPNSALASFSIQPVGTDSAVLDLGPGTKSVTVTALDATGKPIPTSSLMVHYTSSDPNMATINATSGAVSPKTPGTLRLTASTTYYGVTKTDSLNFRIGYQDTLTVTTEASQLPNGTYRYAWTISNFLTSPGKTIIFAVPDMVFNSTTKLLYAGTNLPLGDRLVNEGVQVVFDDSSAAQMTSLPATLLTKQYASNGSGNINLQVPDSVVVVDSIIPASATGAGQYSVKFTKYCTSVPYPCATARSFTTPGTYHFTSPSTGASGTITVVAP